jgi:soluble lytic murein transglycosylase-like protein
MSLLIIVGVILALGATGYFFAGSTSGVSILGGLLGRLSASQIATYAANAGFSGDDLTTAVAIALAESSGNPKAVGDLNVSPGGSVGLWQINLAAHPQYANVDLTDPALNASAAFAVFTQAGFQFTPWSTYNSGKYMAYANEAMGAVQA